jgi:AraC-like DNA-binding protein
MPTPAHPIVSPLFLEYILRQARIKTNVCSYQRSEQGYTLSLRTIPDYNYIFCRRGSLVWEIDGQATTLRAGDLVLVPPRIKHRGYSRSVPITLGSIHVEVALHGGQDVFELLMPPRWRHVARGSRLDRYLQSAVEEWSRGDDAQAMLTMPAYGRLVTLELLRHDAAAGLLRQRPLDPLVSAMLEELNRRVNRGATLDELAIWSGYTPQHVNRIFRRALGVTPLQYLARLRMERAAALLGEGRLTVAAVARAIGLDDPYYFSRLFREHFGCSPSQYGETGSDSPSSGSSFPFSDDRADDSLGTHS